MRSPVLLALLCLSACGEDDRQAPAAKGEPPVKAPAGPAASPEPAPPRPPDEAAEGARAVLRRYYDHLEAGRYAEAWAMRGGGKAGEDAFARNFAAYETYRVTVGQPSEPVSAGGWSFVEVPVMITGTLRSGKGFGSAGSISLRRAAGAAGATAAQRNWHIYTGN